ncbi:MAG: class I SAM-dependent methyltransferase [Candidatus Omnitrophota bacterium]
MVNKIKNEKINRVNRWSDLRAHEIMIRDKLRTLSYKKAIEDNIKSGDAVLDVGCGTGILSFFAAKKGCKKVYAIDKSAIIDDAKKTAQLNNLQDCVEFIKIDILKFKPKEKMDVILHDQIGNFVWDEGLISKITYARDRFLSQGGTMIPYKIDLCFVPVDYESAFEKSILFWSKKKYALNFNNLAKKMLIQQIYNSLHPYIIKLKNKKVFLCKEKLIYSIDLKKEKRLPEKLTANFNLKKGSRLTGMCIYFKVHLDKKNIFSTAPRAVNSHWGQIFLPSFEQKQIKQDSVLNFTLFPQISPKKWKFEFKIIKKT